MDRMRIYSLKKLLDTTILDSHQYLKTLTEFKQKVTIFGNGCLKHGKNELGVSFLNLIPVYEKMAVKKFPMLRECLDA